MNKGIIIAKDKTGVSEAGDGKKPTEFYAAQIKINSVMMPLK